MAENSKVRINPVINLGEIISTVSMLGLLLGFAFAFGRTMENHEVRLNNIEKQEITDRDHMNDRLDKIEGMIEKIGDKLDRKADKNAG